MPTVGDVMDALEEIAPAGYAFPDDRIGLQIGSRDKPVSRVVTSLDSSLAAAEFAVRQGAQMLVCHHPLIWMPLKAILDDRLGRTIRTLIAGDVAFAGVHTNWDAAPGGINDTLADLIGLADVGPFGSSNQVQ